MTGPTFRYGARVGEVYLPCRVEATKASGLEVLTVSLEVCFEF